MVINFHHKYYYYYTIVKDIHKYHMGDVNQESLKNIARKTYH